MAAFIHLHFYCCVCKHTIYLPLHLDMYTSLLHLLELMCSPSAHTYSPSTHSAMQDTSHHQLQENKEEERHLSHNALFLSLSLTCLIHDWPVSPATQQSLLCTMLIGAWLKREQERHGEEKEEHIPYQKKSTVAVVHDLRNHLHSIKKRTHQHTRSESSSQMYEMWREVQCSTHIKQAHVPCVLLLMHVWMYQPSPTAILSCSRPCASPMWGNPISLASFTHLSCYY